MIFVRNRLVPISWRAARLLFFLARQRLRKQTRQFRVFHHYGWVSLDRGKILLLESVTAFGRSEHFSRKIESGVRVARLDANGERTYLDDKQRAAELQRNQDIISQNCGK